MPTFDIETYKVSSHLESPSPDKHNAPIRILEMSGPLLHDGIVNRARFLFSNKFDAKPWSGIAGYLKETGNS